MFNAKAFEDEHASVFETINIERDHNKEHSRYWLTNREYGLFICNTTGAGQIVNNDGTPTQAIVINPKHGLFILSLVAAM